MNLLTLIIPIRCNDFEFYKKRIELRSKLDLQMVETIIVNDGSPVDVSKDIEDFCNKNNYKYLYADTKDIPFSLSRARNLGIQASKTKWIGFEDADLIYSVDHYQKILKILNNLNNTPFNFLTVPTIYLKEEISKRIFDEVGVDQFITEILSANQLESHSNNEKNQIIESFASASSVIYLEKKEALKVGGFDEEFFGWGGEDRDFVFKLLQINDKIQKPKKFEITSSQHLNEISIYEGWRSLYKIIGSFLQNQGIYAFHLYHEKLEWRGKNSSSNIELAKLKALDYAKKKRVPLVFDKELPVQIVIGYNPHLYNNQILSTLPNPLFIDENTNILSDDFVELILNYNPEAIIMWNPYGRPWRLEVYRKLKIMNKKIIVAERGALPNSIYFDENGLCVESSSYSEDKWNYNLNFEEEQSIADYIDNLRFGNAALENQADRCGISLLRFKLGIDKDKKILFCPLQLSDDTVTTYFSEENRSYQQYLLELKKVASSLPSDWVFVYKNHPLSIGKFDCINGICADSYHINDLIEASTVVSVFNSGVGLIAQAFMKPVLHYGKCFYHIDDVNYHFLDAQWCINFLKNVPTIDQVKIKRFYFYLINKFYSNAEWEVVLDKKSDISKRNKLTSIFYNSVRIPGYKVKIFEKKSFDIKKTMLFSPYKFYISQEGKLEKSTRVVDKVSKPNMVESHNINTPRKIRLQKKWNKLKNNPYLFFNDSSNKALRKLRVLFED